MVSGSSGCHFCHSSLYVLILSHLIQVPALISDFEGISTIVYSFFQSFIGKSHLTVADFHIKLLEITDLKVLFEKKMSTRKISLRIAKNPTFAIETLYVIYTNTRSEGFSNHQRKVNNTPTLPSPLTDKHPIQFFFPRPFHKTGLKAHSRKEPSSPFSRIREPSRYFCKN